MKVDLNDHDIVQIGTDNGLISIAKSVDGDIYVVVNACNEGKIVELKQNSSFAATVIMKDKE